MYDGCCLIWDTPIKVIILSTDTEVDRDFYTELSPDISQAYQIHYDSQEGASSEEEGYFWRKTDEELLHAS